MKRALHWFREDLRLNDNTALSAVARASDELTLVFVFEERLISSEMQGAPRIRFLRDSVDRLARECEKRGHKLVVRRGDPRDEIPKLAAEVGAQRVTWNRSYGPYARARDVEVERRLRESDLDVSTCKDRVIWESNEILTQQNRAFAVYSPYKRAWWQRLADEPLKDASPLRLPGVPKGVVAGDVPTAQELGVDSDATEIPTAGEAAAQRRLRSFLDEDVAHYAKARDYPAQNATSRLSPYLRFGAISVRRCVREAQAIALEDARVARGVQVWLDELVWREFYNAILADHPRVLRGAHRTEYDAIRWENDPKLFEAWCNGQTGFPFVDAGMRELAATGFMHNRVRMVVASFLTKDLLIDWRQGERHFMRHLVDGDPASNNGGWQWSASTGTDAQPYFRIFNPVTQGERFDPDGEYIRHWVPELAHLDSKAVHQPWKAPLEAPGYPAPIVDHKQRRLLALERYKAARAGIA